MNGLSYKNRRGYLTAEEWYAGMTCWYVCIECGWREYIAAETPALAVQRAVVFMRMTIDRRDTHPDDRSDHIQTDIENLWYHGHSRTKYALKGLFMIAERLLRLAERQEAYNNGERRYD